MRILGAIIAGGQARRFGSDKAAAMLKGSALIDHVFEGLKPQVTQVAIAGRPWRDLPALSDRPSEGLGPLAGLNAALHHARDRGFDAVLSAGCDTLPVPPLLAETLSGDVPAYVADHFLMGYWPSSLAETLDKYLAGSENRSMRDCIEHCGARPVRLDTELYNLNTPEALAAYARLTAS